MPIDVKMPKLSDNMEEGIIVRWLKAVGEQVTRGELLAEVETDKADVELEAADSGVLRDIRVAEGQRAAVGAVIAVLVAPGEAQDVAARAASAPAGRGEALSAVDHVKSSEPDVPAREGAEGPEAGVQATAGSSGRVVSSDAVRGDEPAGRGLTSAVDGAHGVRASPLAWRVAEEAGVNLTAVTGSGPGGRILKRDVEATVGAVQGKGGGRVPAKKGPTVAGRSDTRPARAPEPLTAGRLETLSRMRRTIARRMVDAKREIPHFYIAAEIDMSETMRMRHAIKQSGVIPRLTVTHMLAKAMAVAVDRHPRVNASWCDDGVEFHADVNIGIAVALDEGLIVPVLHQVQRLTLAEVAEKIARLTERARSGRFGGDDLSGATISLSNVGGLDVDRLAAVINPPHAAILAVGAVKDRPVVRAGQLAVGTTMHATLSCDHRVLNGVEGGRFLEELKRILESPVTLVME